MPAKGTPTTTTKDSESPAPRSASRQHQSSVVDSTTTTTVVTLGTATSTTLRHSMEAEREARRERRARIERQVQAALYEQRTQHATAVGGLKAQLLELKHQDDLAAVKHQAKARESTLMQELANLQRQLDDERNRRVFIELSIKKATDAQRLETERRDAAEAALAAEIAKRGATDGNSGELQRRVDALQRQLIASKTANDQLLRENRERSVAAVDQRAAEEAAMVSEMDRLKTQLSCVSEQRTKDHQQYNQRLEIERVRHTESIDLLNNEADALRATLEEERRKHRADQLAAQSRERALQDAKERETRTVEAQVGAAVADMAADVLRLEGELADERRAREKEKLLVAKRDAAEADRRARYAKELLEKDNEYSQSITAIQDELTACQAERDQLRADGNQRRDKAIASEARLATLRTANEQLTSDKQSLEDRLTALEVEMEESKRKGQTKLSELDATHKDTIAQLNKKLREALVAAQEAEDKGKEWDRALKEAHDRIEADTKALDAKYSGLVASHERDQQHQKEMIAAQEQSFAATKGALEEALRSEKAQHAVCREQLAALSLEYGARQDAAQRDHNDALAKITVHHEVTIRRLEEAVEEERVRRRDVEHQKVALHEGFDDLSKEYDTAVTSMELLEQQLHETRAAHEQSIAILTRELERNRATRSQSVVAADSAEAEAAALRAENQILKRKLKRNVCFKCGGSGFGSPIPPPPHHQIVVAANSSVMSSAAGADRSPLMLMVSSDGASVSTHKQNRDVTTYGSNKNGEGSYNNNNNNNNNAMYFSNNNNLATDSRRTSLTEHHRSTSHLDATTMGIEVVGSNNENNMTPQRKDLFNHSDDEAELENDSVDGFEDGKRYGESGDF